MFRVNPNGTGFTNIYNFDGGFDGAPDWAGVVRRHLVRDDQQRRHKRHGNGVRPGTNGGGFSVLWAFSETNVDTGANADGANPADGLVLSDGALFGTAENGGVNGNGTAFSINTNGSGFTVLTSFSAGNYNDDNIWTNADGVFPWRACYCPAPRCLERRITAAQTAMARCSSSAPTAQDSPF